MYVIVNVNKHFELFTTMEIVALKHRIILKVLIEYYYKVKVLREYEFELQERACSAILMLQ